MQLLCILQVPLALDSLGNYILIAFAPLELTLLHVVVTPASGPNKTPTANFHTVRQLSIMSVGQPITVRTFTVPLTAISSTQTKVALVKHALLSVLLHSATVHSVSSLTYATLKQLKPQSFYLYDFIWFVLQNYASRCNGNMQCHNLLTLYCSASR